MKNFNDAIDFYSKVYKLKTLLRAGWVKRGIPAGRIESVAEHCFGMSILAISIWQQMKINLNIEKVLIMIAIHEFGEVYIGDIIPMDGIDKKQKYEMERKAFSKVIGNHMGAQYFMELWEEFERKETIEAKFVYSIDKLQAVLQAEEYSQTYDMPELFAEFYTSYEKDMKNRDLPNYYYNIT